MSGRPITFIRENGILRPFGVGMASRFDDDYGEGEIVRLSEFEDASDKSRSHFFAVLRELYLNLPEGIRKNEDWAESETHMRKYAMIKTGHYNLQEWPCESVGEAKRWAARLKPQDEYSIVLQQGSVVRVYTAKSMKRTSMPGKGEWQKAKEDVLGYLADLLKLPAAAEQRKP